jgi:DnaJ-class molecular chaperone
MKYSIKECCVLFDIENINSTDIHEIRKKYHKLCLKHHPDRAKKTRNNIDFIYIKDCYEILVDFKENEVFDHNNEFDIYNYFLSFINVDNIEKIFTWLNNQKDIVNLHVDLNSLFNKELYYVDDNYYVPLWCKSITNKKILDFLNIKSNINRQILYVIHVKNSYSYVKILDNNDVVVYVKDMEKYIDKKVKISLCESKSFEIMIDDAIQKSKYHILMNQGIPRFNDENIYDCSQLSNIIICFH